MDEFAGLRKWWNGASGRRPNCTDDPEFNANGCGADATFSHVKYAGYLHGPTKLVSRWNATWLNGFAERHDLRGKHVVDYGIGAGLLGAEMLGARGASHYTGIDIANRSLTAARKLLHHATNQKVARDLLRHATNRTLGYAIQEGTYDFLLAPVEFAPLRADVFISQAVVQHFPSMAFCDDFFARLERSHIPVIFLQLKHASPPRCLNVSTGEGFAIKEYARHVLVACSLDQAYLRSRLPSYRSRWESFQYNVGGFMRPLNTTHGRYAGRPPQHWPLGLEMLVDLELRSSAR